MRVKVDEKNRAIIAEGNFKGKRIKAVVVCKEPEFDREFGEKLVKQKYKINLKQYKLKRHEQEIGVLNKFKAWADSLIDDNHRNIDMLEEDLAKETDAYFQMLQEKFPNEQM